MRLEADDRNGAVRSASPLLEIIEAMDHRILSLSAAFDVEARNHELKQLGEEASSLRMYCSSVRAYGLLMATLSDFEIYVENLRVGTIPMDNRVGGLLMHAVSSFRHGVQNLGTTTRTAERLAQVLSDLRRVMNRASAPVAAPQIAKPEYRELFQSDESFKKLASISAALEENPSLLEQAETIDEMFRVYHTIKGNAAMIGISGLSDYAHAIEDVLNAARERKIPRDRALAAFFIGCARRIKDFLAKKALSNFECADLITEIGNFITFQTETANRTETVTETETESQSSVSLSSSSPTGFYLTVHLSNRRILLPCESVSNVVRQPHIMLIPGTHSNENWLGVIRSRGELVPLLDPRALIKTTQSPPALSGWVVVLRGPESSSLDSPLFSIPVDDVGDVVELPYDAVDATVLDPVKLNVWG